MQHLFSLKPTWFSYNLIAVFSIIALLFSPQALFAQEGGNNDGNSLAACQVTGIIFDKRQYALGDIINVTVRVADSQGTPLGGAVVRATIDKQAVQAAASEGFGLVDRVGEYDGTYANTDVNGQYTFKVVVSDPTGNNFANCSASDAVLVGKIQSGTPVVTAEPTDVTPTVTTTATTIVPTPETPTVTPTITPTAETPTVTPTITPTAETPTVTPTPETPTVTPTITPTAETPTPTPTVIVGGPTLSFDPSKTVFDSCGTAAQTVLNIASVSNLVGIEFKLTYDPKVVQVVDANSSKAGVQISNNGAFAGGFEVRNEVDTVKGEIFFAATLLGKKIDGQAKLVAIDWLPQGTGTTQARFDNLALADGNGQKINATPQNASIEVKQSCTAAVSGSVNLQGRTNHSGVTVIGSSGEQVETAADGTFTVNGGEPVILSKAGFLRAKVEVGTAAQAAGGDLSATSVGQVTLIAGDINQDGTINILDLAYIAQKYQTQDALADLNGDGEADIFDLSMAAGNYGQSEDFGLTGAAYDAGDLNKDGKVDIFDQSISASSK